MSDESFEMKPKKELLKRIHGRDLHFVFCQHVEEKVRLDVTQK